MIPYLSYSSINLYLTCPENWRRKYFEKQPQPSTPALIVGSAFHGTVERAVIANTEAGGLGPRLAAIWPNVWSEKMEADGANVEWGADTPDQHFNDGLRLVSAKPVQEMVAGVRPLVDDAGHFIERKVSIDVPGVPVPIIGYIDIVTADGVPGDFKTSSTRWSQDKAEGEIQPLFYLAALHQMGMPSPGNRFRHYVVTKTKTPDAMVIEHTHTWDEIFWLYELVRQVWRGIEAEIFPTNPNGWLCSAKWCAYWGDCRGKRWQATGRS